MNKQKSFKVSRLKGITPVVAIVLLLLVTVGAVGIVYTQFQGIVNKCENSECKKE
jgi:FlaG/FlaF family flagellin (archaellin)